MARERRRAGFFLLVWRHHIIINILKICYRQSKRGISKEYRTNTKQYFVYTQKFFLRRRFLHTKAFFLYTKLLHTEAFTHKNFYTNPFTHKAFTRRPFYTRTLLHRDAFTHRHRMLPRPTTDTMLLDDDDDGEDDDDADIIIGNTGWLWAISKIWKIWDLIYRYLHIIMR